MVSLYRNVREHASLAGYVLKWSAMVTPLGLIVGSACAVFLWSLEKATAWREAMPWLLWGLPAAGVAIGLMYWLLGRSVEAGNNLIVDEIHEPGGGVPARMTPLVLIGTVITHLFGGSAGREGTAVQMGGSIASTLARVMPWLNEADVRTMLMAGIAAGFGGVFGTPLTGAVFALEVIAVGRKTYEAVFPCLFASIISDWACHAWGIRHVDYHHLADFATTSTLMNWGLLLKVVVASAVFGLASVMFSELTHGLGKLFKRIMPVPWLRPIFGAVIVIATVWLLGTRDYLGLGVSSADPHAVTIVSSFHAGGATPWSWWWKLFLTAVTLSAGFKGGEVTPLFFIGAALGNTMAWLLGSPVELFAALGFVAVFSGATNTPLACTIMAIELFGPGHVVYYGVACFVAYVFSGHTGIYSAQRIAAPKLALPELPPGIPLRSVHQFHTATLRRPIRSEGPAARIDTLSDLGASRMTHSHHVHARELGHLLIHLTPRCRRPGKTGFKAMLGCPLYQEIIRAAKADGILSATAYPAQFGYAGAAKLQANEHLETPNGNITLRVELVDERAKLELFCRRHGDLLRNRVVVFKPAEHWELHPHQPERAADEAEPLSA